MARCKTCKPSSIRSFRSREIRVQEMHVVDASHENLVLRELTVTPVSKVDARQDPFDVFRKIPGGYVVPRFWRPDLGRCDLPSVESKTMRFKGSLRNGQSEACDAVSRSLNVTGGAILSLPTGSGKTVCALWIVAKLNVKTLVVVHKWFLRDQFIKSIRDMLTGCSVSVVDGNTKDFSGDIVIGTIQTLLNMQTIPDMGCVVIDETHHIAARSFSQLMLNVSCRYVLGLSATPFRGDGLWPVVEYLCGKIAYQKRLTNSKNVDVRVVKYTPKNFIEPLDRRGKLDYAALVTGLVMDRERNALIADIIRRHPKDLLVLTHRRDHCFAIKKLVPNVDIGTYVGGDTSVPDSDVIVSTYPMTSEGFDCPRLRTLVLATPVSNVQQACGRVMRGGDHRSIIYDIVDNTSIGRGQARKRKTFYASAGFVVHDGSVKIASGPKCMFV